MNQSGNIANPFPGLRPFETEEYRLFFGREGQSDELLERLARTRFLAVIGTSGSGKSSLVRAGLLPAMRGGLMAGAGSGWRIAVTRPGHDPIGNLACVLAEKDVLPEAGGGFEGAEAEAVIEATLRRGSLGLVDAARQARLSSHGNLLVVIDQFEELFRFRTARAGTSSGDDAAAFVKLLLEAARQRELPIYVVLTMRSDFLGDCSQFQGLPEAINDGQYLIPRMTRDERRMAITGPVGVARARLADPLINRLLNDVGDNPDQLPILQHALMRTWDYWKQNRLDGQPIGVEHYEAIGTMSAALSRHADEAFNELDSRQQKIAERMFKALTEKGADNREIRRPARLSKVCAIVEATPEEVVSVVEVFRRVGRSFLMPPVGVALDSDTVIDISHESLIRNWERLKKWVDEEAESAHMYRRLAYAAEAGSYISGSFLETTLDWREQYKPNATWAERYHAEVGLTTTFEQVSSFLDASASHRDTLVEEEERRRLEESERKRRELEHAQAFASQQQRAKRRLLWLAAALCLISLFALGTAYIAGSSWRKAKQAKEKAEKMQEAGTAYRDALSFLKIKNVYEARKRFDKAATQFAELNDISGAASSYMELGDTYFNASLGQINHNIGATYYDKAETLNLNNKDLNNKASVLRVIGNTYINSARAVLDQNSDAKGFALNLLGKGQNSLERALKIYRDKDDQESQIIILNQLVDGNLDGRFWDDSKAAFANAVKYYEQLLEIYKNQSSLPQLKKTALPNHRALALKLADILEEQLGKPADAERYRNEALEVARRHGGVDEEATTRLEIARAFGPGELQSQEFEKAVKLFEGATDRLPEAALLIKLAQMRLKLYRKITVNKVNLREGPSTTTEVIGSLEKSKDQDMRVLVLIDGGDWIKVKLKEKKGFIYSNFAKKEQEVSDTTSEGLKSALGYFQRALEIYQAQGMLKEQADLLQQMADADINAGPGGDDKRALKSLNQALEIYKKLDDITSQNQVMDKIAAINKR
jgi:Bacterial SH3 domain.